MMEAKRYDCRAILVAHCLALASDGKPDLRAALASVGIPKDRLDVALRKIQPVMFGATQIVRLYKHVAESDEKLREMVEALFDKAVWIDDDKGEINANITVYAGDGEDGEEPMATVTVVTTIKGEDEDA